MDDNVAPPLVSIVTPSLNQGEFIEDTIRSVLGQDYMDIEYLVVDGGSRDGTIDILRQHGDALRWTSGPDGGQSDAINRGLLATSGEILAWLNADDRYLPGAVRAAAEAFLEDPTLDLVYGMADFIDRSGAPLGPCRHVAPWDLSRLVQRVNFIVQPAVFFRRAAFEAVGGLNADLHYVMDYDLWIRLGSRGHVRYLPRVLAEVRVHAATKTATGGLPRLAEMERMARRHGRRGVPEQYQREMIRALAEASFRAARERRARDAVRHAWRLTQYGFMVIGPTVSRRLRRLRPPSEA